MYTVDAIEKNVAFISTPMALLKVFFDDSQEQVIVFERRWSNKIESVFDAPVGERIEHDVIVNINAFVVLDTDGTDGGEVLLKTELTDDVKKAIEFAILEELKK